MGKNIFDVMTEYSVNEGLDKRAALHDRQAYLCAYGKRGCLW